jgi:hypothetical protein
MCVFIPRRVLLAWPQFGVEDRWVGVEEIFGGVHERAFRATAFANNEETLFEAVQSTVIDFDGRTRACSTGCDLSRFIDEDGGIFDTRDDLFARIGSFEDTLRGRAFEWLYAGRSTA